MKDYHADRIKNVALVGHAGSGKTSLAEAILYSNGDSDRLGKIADGNTICDHDPEEIKRRASIGMAVAPFEYKDTKINLLDAPGLFDFEAGLREAISACGSVIIAVSGKSGVTVGAKKAYKLAEKYHKAKMIVVTKMDNENADFYKVLEGLKTSFGPSVCPLVVPIYKEKNVDCYISLIDMKAYQYQNGKAVEIVMPRTEHRLDGLISAISEAVAETDEALFEKYFNEEALTHEEMVNGIHKGVKAGTITPVLCASAFTMDGIDLLKDFIVDALPFASENDTEAVDPDGNVITIKADSHAATSAYVFKTIADPFIGKLSFIKVLSGRLTAGLLVNNMTTGEEEKLGKLLFIRGKKQEDTKQINAGDIGVIAKLSSNTGDTLCVGCRYKVEKMEFPAPCYSIALTAKAKGEESKIAQGIGRMLEEDLTLAFKQNNETHQLILSGLGEQHLDVVLAKLKSKFGIDAGVEVPMVAYRETIRKKVKVQGKHKKQSGGHGQFGDVWVEFEPCDSTEMVFEQAVVGGSVPKNYFPAVEKGLRDCIGKGPLAGYPVVGLKATLVDGSYHPVDSSEASFKMAAAIAYRAALPQASPVLLEPIGNLKVNVPDANTGDMMGELNKRRGRVLGMTPQEDGVTEIEAEVPMSEMSDFATLVRQMTQGAGNFSLTFERYEPLPQMLEAGVIEKAKVMFEAAQS